MSAHAIAAQLAERVSELSVVLGSSGFGAGGLQSGALRAAELPGALGVVGEVRRLIDAVGAELAGQVDASSATALGEKTPADVVAIHAHLPLYEARDWCRVGQALHPETTPLGEVLELERPAVAASVESGAVTVAAASRVLASLDEVGRFVSPEKAAGLESTLVQLACELSVRELGKLCRGLPDLFCPEGSQRREELLRSRSGVRITQLPDGLTRWIVTMHPEAAGFLTAALDARTAPRRQPTFEVDAFACDPAADDRTLPQRRLDALESMARESLEHDTGVVAGTSVSMVVTIPLDNLMSDLGGAKIEGIDQPISAGTARRLAAQAEIIPLVLGTPSQPLDVGALQRLATPAQRHALSTRDEGCLWPGCQAPPGWCEVAHLTAWQFGGTTDLRNLALLCPHHHRRYDHDGWTMRWRGDELFLIPPGHIDVYRTPRRVGPARIAA
ncbi:HNH endonuclease signature motif containing protein [soil metagenome]